MGAFGAALLARDRYHGQQSTMLPLVREFLRRHAKRVGEILEERAAAG